MGDRFPSEEAGAAWQRNVAASDHLAQHLGEAPALVLVLMPDIEMTVADDEGVMDVGPDLRVGVPRGAELRAGRPGPGPRHRAHHRVPHPRGRGPRDLRHPRPLPGRGPAAGGSAPRHRSRWRPAPGAPRPSPAGTATASAAPPPDPRATPPLALWQVGLADRARRSLQTPLRCPDDRLDHRRLPGDRGRHPGAGAGHVRVGALGQPVGPGHRAGAAGRHPTGAGADPADRPDREGRLHRRPLDAGRGPAGVDRGHRRGDLPELHACATSAAGIGVLDRWDIITDEVDATSIHRDPRTSPGCPGTSTSRPATWGSGRAPSATRAMTRFIEVSQAIERAPAHARSTCSTRTTRAASARSAGSR